MATIIEIDLKELLTKHFDEVNQKFDEVNRKFDEIRQQNKETNQKIDNLQKEVNQKFDHLTENVNDVKVSATRIETEMVAIKEDVKSLKGTTQSRIWVLITLLGGSLIAVGFKTFIGNV